MSRSFRSLVVDGAGGRRAAPLASIGIGLVAAALVVGAACSGTGLNKLDTGPGGFNGDSGADTNQETGSNGDTGVPIQPTWWSIDGSLTMTGGVPATQESTLTFGFWSADGTESCTIPATLDAVLTDDPPTGVPTYGWWALALTPGDGTCARDIPLSLNLGIGQLDQRLFPAMEAHEPPYDPDTTSLYGVYVQTDGPDSSVFVFGIAGVPGNFDGSVPAVTAAPVPDGVYAVTGLQLLPL